MGFSIKLRDRESFIREYVLNRSKVCINLSGIEAAEDAIKAYDIIEKHIYSDLKMKSDGTYGK